jgi:hypothetical protein
MTQDASIVLRSPRPWFGNQQLGAFVISMDGTKVGVLMPEGSLSVGCSAGRHDVRARRGWFRSQSTEVDLGSGEVVELVVDLDHPDSLFWRFLLAAFAPWRSLAITAPAG